MARGGRRSGTKGKAYANRTDLNSPALGVGQSTYGDKAAQARSLSQVPLPRAPQGPPPSSAQAGAAPAGAAPPPGIAPGLPFDRPTDRPGEPLTAGMSMGAGPGPSASMPAFDPILETLRGAFLMSPSPQLQSLIEARQRSLRSRQ